ncbi:MAG: 3-oxoacyl-[acyl-carrier protein] reductase [Candidatus Carbobacillus altaicus]|uniref:3-oxoacyl-[acyl-carrier-protein] reductase n=1 Tax=Candidatus Carbonibacillus altaicus TaxID=2163959 RepID=A0A2R6Y5G9_9BACL|nr:MAG: 3-oxoacyl-[acyl-carrier protein] reductase [Candidatus Carbobacillus altaicus]
MEDAVWQQDLKGKVALVTGASRGIGRAIALALGDLGARVVVGYVSDEMRAQNVVSELKARGAEGRALRIDVKNIKEAPAVIDDVLAVEKALHILVNNAGIARDNLLIRMKEEEWYDVLETNLTGAYALTKAAARPMMKARWGRIINISSIVGVIGNVGQANYVASKAGLIGLTKAVAKELASRNITVNAVAPGFIETEMTEKLPDDLKTQMKALIPLGSFGAPEDVAAVVRFLASEGARYMTGQVLHVDGGMVM